MVRYLRGVFVGDTDDLAAKDREYPIFRWSSKLKTFRREASGLFTTEPEETMTARFSDDVRFVQQSYEIWGSPGGISQVPDKSGEETTS
jgi:hypothetical protein